MKEYVVFLIRYLRNSKLVLMDLRGYRGVRCLKTTIISGSTYRHGMRRNNQYGFISTLIKINVDKLIRCVYNQIILIR